MPSPINPISFGLQRLEEAKRSYLAGEADSTEAILDAARAILIAGGGDLQKQPVALNGRDEKPSDFLQRVMWAEVSWNHILGFLYYTEPTLTSSHSPSCRQFLWSLYKLDCSSNSATLAPKE